jgi:hypothetical protein
MENILKIVVERHGDTFEKVQQLLSSELEIMNETGHAIYRRIKADF